METRVGEARGNARELERRAQECLADILAFGRVITALAFGIPEVDRLVHLALVDEFSCQHTSALDHLALMVERLVDDGEAVSPAQVPVKIDVGGEDIGDLDCHSIGEIGGIGGGKQRASDLA